MWLNTEACGKVIHTSVKKLVYYIHLRLEFFGDDLVAVKIFKSSKLFKIQMWCLVS